jgi:hypothetical protein
MVSGPEETAEYLARIQRETMRVAAWWTTCSSCPGHLARAAARRGDRRARRGRLRRRPPPRTRAGCASRPTTPRGVAAVRGGQRRRPDPRGAQPGVPRAAPHPGRRRGAPRRPHAGEGVARLVVQDGCGGIPETTCPGCSTSATGARWPAPRGRARARGSAWRSPSRSRGHGGGLAVENHGPVMPVRAHAAAGRGPLPRRVRRWPPRPAPEPAPPQRQRPSPAQPGLPAPELERSCAAPACTAAGHHPPGRAAAVSASAPAHAHGTGRPARRPSARAPCRATTAAGRGRSPPAPSPSGRAAAPRARQQPLGSAPDADVAVGSSTWPHARRHGRERTEHVAQQHRAPLASGTSAAPPARRPRRPARRGQHGRHQPARDAQVEHRAEHRSSSHSFAPAGGWRASGRPRARDPPSLRSRSVGPPSARGVEPCPRLTAGPCAHRAG